MKLKTNVGSVKFNNSTALFGNEISLRVGQKKDLTDGTMFDDDQNICREMLGALYASGLIKRSEVVNALEDLQNPGVAAERQDITPPSIRVRMKDKIVRLGPQGDFK